MILERSDVQLYIEGIRVPVIQASCSSSLNTFTMCNFSIPATYEGLKLEYRSHVQLYVWDQLAMNYMLLFDGELISNGFSMSSSDSSCHYSAAGFYHQLRQRTIMFAGGIGSTGNMSGGSQGVDEILSSGTSGFSPVGLLTNFFSISNEKTDKVKDLNVVNGLKKLLDGMYDNSDALEKGSQLSKLLRNGVESFFAQCGATKKLRASDSNRYYINDSPTLNKLVGINASSVNDTFYNQMQNDITGRMSRWDIIMRMISMFVYDISMPLGTIKNSFIAKPAMHFCVPPKCNVLFPNAILNLSFNNSYSNKITRTFSNISSSVPSWDGASTYYNWSPKIINKNILETLDQTKAAADTNFGFGAYPGLTSDSGSTWESSWETKYGIQPGFTTLYSPFILAAALSANKENLSGSAPKEYLKIQEMIQNYERLKMFYSSGTLSFNCRFSPGLTAGFPILLIRSYVIEKSKRFMAFIGHLDNVSHNLVPGTGYGTSGSVSMVRIVGDTTTKGDVTLELSDGLPWLASSSATGTVSNEDAKGFNDKFSARKIGENFYKPALGSDAAFSSSDAESETKIIFDKFDSIMTSNHEQSEIEQEIEVFTTGYTRNRLFTYWEESDTMYKGSYDEGRATVVEDYTKSLGIRSDDDMLQELVILPKIN